MAELLNIENKDVNSKCRGCLTLTSEAEMHDLFVELIGENLKLIDVLESTTSIKVIEDKKLSRHLCLKCSATVVSFYNFKLCLQENEHYARLLLEQIIKNEGTLVSDGSKNSNSNSLTPSVLESMSVVNKVDIKDEDVHFGEMNDVCSKELCDPLEIPREDIRSDEIDRSIKYESTVCSLSYGRKDWLTNHILEHHNPNRTDFSNSAAVCKDIKVVVESCNSQGVVKGEKLNIEEVQVSEGKEPAQYKCTICSASYIRQGCLENHRLKKHVQNVKNPSENSVLVSNEVDVKLDIKTSEIKEKNQFLKIKKVTRYHCEVCGTSYLNKPCFKHHMLGKHNMEINDCSIYSSTSFIEQEHKGLRVLIKVEKYCCSACRTTYNRKSRFKKHMRDKHDINVTDFNQYLKVVTVAINQKSDLNCLSCNETFKTMEELSTHKRKHRPFICEQCGASFPRKSDLSDHLPIHSDIFRYVCSFCGKAFRARTTHARHVQIHTKPWQCVCEICGRRFTHRSAMKTHIQLKHDRSVKFPCSSCNKVFTLKSSVKIHYMRIHAATRENKFKCQFCGVAYKDKYSLKRHIEFKHDDATIKPSCKFCGKQLSSNTKVRWHIARFHKNELSEDIEKT